MFPLTASQTEKSHTRALFDLSVVGLGVVTAFFVMFGGWAARAPLAGAVVSTGQLVVTSHVKTVQHPTGGIVSQMLVSEGDRVQEGQVLIRLDETVVRASLQSVLKKIDELTARTARLQAERLDFQPLEFPQPLLDREGDPAVAEILVTERALYEARRDAQTSRKARLQQQVDQLHSQIDGLIAEQAARRRQKEITVKELESLRLLDRQNLVQSSRLNGMEREAVNLDGELGQLHASMAAARGKILETEIQIGNVVDDLRAENTKELREVQAEIAQQEEKKTAAQDQLRRVEIRAPIMGIVHQLNAHTVGGVIKAGDPIMLVVPLNEPLQIEARVVPQDIDQVHLEQEANVHLLAFNRRATPELKGRVSRISADVTKDQQSGASYYTIRVALLPEEIAKLKDLQLSAGMQAEVFVQTAERTPLEYLVKPVRDQIARAFNER